jgi:hypothetical protein
MPLCARSSAPGLDLTACHSGMQSPGHGNPITGAALKSRRYQFGFRSGSSGCGMARGSGIVPPRVRSHSSCSMTCRTTAKRWTVSTSTCSFGLP